MRRNDRGNPDPSSICLLCTPRPGNTKGERFQPRGSGNVREFRPLPVAAEYRVLLASLLFGRLTCPVHCPGYGNGIPEKCAYVLSIPSSQLCLCELQPVFLGCEVTGGLLGAPFRTGGSFVHTISLVSPAPAIRWWGKLYLFLTASFTEGWPSSLWPTRKSRN